MASEGDGALALSGDAERTEGEGRRAAGHATLAKVAETTIRYVFLLAIFGLLALAWQVASHW
jgi:hypothetical protein